MGDADADAVVDGDDAPTTSESGAAPETDSGTTARAREKWWNGALGGVVIGALAATLGTFVTDERARSADRAAVREERRVEAYSELILTAEEATLFVSRESKVDPEDRPQLHDLYGTPFDFYRDNLGPAIARVRLVGSDRMTDIAIDLTEAYVDLLEEPDDLKRFTDLVALMAVTAGSEVG